MVEESFLNWYFIQNLAIPKYIINQDNIASIWFTFNPLAKFSAPDVFFTKYGGMNALRAFVLGSKVLIGETLSKAVLVSGTSALARLLIDLLIPDIY